MALLAVAIEVFGFNLGYFTSMFYDEVSGYLVYGQDASTVGTLTFNASDNTFEITGLNDNVKSIHFNITYADPAAAEQATGDGELTIVMSLTDEGNANYYNLPSVSIDPTDESSTYINIDPSGKCHSIRVQFTNLNQIGTIYVTGIEINAHEPLNIDFRRLASTFAILLLLYELRPQSSLFARIFSTSREGRKNLLVGLAIIEVVIVFMLVMSNTHFVQLVHTSATENYFQYQKLARALLEGHLYLDDQPSAALMAMANPYDTNARAAQGVAYLWDHAYYQGHYYVYFGILPCLVFYVPWLLITGTDFPTWLGIAICDAAYMVGLIYLLYQICRRWFPRTSVGAFISLDLILAIGGGALIIARTPSMYYFPEAMGLMLIAWGLGLWVSGTSQGYIEKGKVNFGAFLIALTLACRPQMILAAVIGLLLLHPFLHDAYGAPTRKQAKKAFRSALVPFIVVGLAVCTYNYLRFGSPFDFGANYNLTTNDMIHRGFHIDRIPFGLFAYLFQPPVFVSQFPFLHQTYMDPAYQGITIYEAMYGGYLFLYPATFVLFTLPRAKEGLKERKLFGGVITLLLIAFVIVNFDLQGAGILTRYMSDFGIYIALATVITFLQFTQVSVEAPLQKGWTQQFGATSSGSHVARNGVSTISIYRIALYGLSAALVLTLIMSVLLWYAFGMY